MNGIPNSMQTQLWIFGPGSKVPNKYAPERGYNVENLEEWLMSAAGEFGITLTEPPKVELPPDDEDPVAPAQPEKSEQEAASTLVGHVCSILIRCATDHVRILLRSGGSCEGE